MTPRAVRSLAVAAALYAVFALWPFAASLGCADECFIDHAALYGDFALLARNDTRLNAWILAWVQHSLLTAPGTLFDANSFHPARGTLAGSEHLIGLALQLLPARAFTASAVVLHQLALALSAWLLGLSTFALVRWLVRPAWIAFAAGAVAIAMPWRQLELMHVQMLSAHWIPLLWLLALRGLTGEARRVEAWIFAAILALQLLSSYYVAYLATISLGVLAIAAAAQRAVRLRGALRLAGAALPAYLLLGAISLPYLARAQRGEIPTIAAAAWERPEVGSLLLEATWQTLVPRGLSPAWQDGVFVPSFAIPATLVALSVVGMALLLGSDARRKEAPALLRRQRVVCVSLLCVSLFCFTLMLGNRLHFDARSIELPAGWLARILPGFASLRSPVRWAIPIALAAPVLAGVGLALVCERACARFGPRTGLASVALPVLALLAFELRPGSLGAEPVWAAPERSRAASAALAALPPGPALELPWEAAGWSLLTSESSIQLASTRHWRPILNGFTAYPPASYDLLSRLARGLPSAATLADLARFTGLRWVVLDHEQLTPDARRAWEAAEAEGRLRRAWSDGWTTILELPETPERGALAAAVAAPSPERTLLGVSRAALGAEALAGRLRVTGEVGPASRLGNVRHIPLDLEIENASARDWPGLDPQPEGLVALRYAFADADGAFVSGGVAPLDVDVPAGRSVRVRPIVAAPRAGGRFRLCLDLVQRSGGELRGLPIDPVERTIELADLPPPAPGGASRLTSFATLIAIPSEVTSDRCAARR